MEFVLIDSILRDRGLHCPELEILDQDSRLYNSLVFQPVAELEYGDDYLRYSNHAQACQKFESFLGLSRGLNVELAITPEYSCPWNVITDFIDQNNLPGKGKLWVLGSQAIKTRELSDTINNHRDIEWIYDNELINSNLDSNRLLDPVCYIFESKTLADERESKKVIIIQFKTHQMGGTYWERDNLILGNEVYVLRNINESSRLFTLICSDALGINNNQYYDGFINNPHLIIHVQLNPKPHHDNFRNYRTGIFQYDLDNKEVICANWAKDVVMNGQNFSQFGGSAIYMKNSDKVNVAETRLDTNQIRGLSFTFWKEKRTCVYIFDYDERIFHYRNTKPSQQMDFPPNHGKTGPEVIGNYVWRRDNWESDQHDCKFNNLCRSINNEFQILNGNPTAYVNIERVITLSIGRAVSKNWFLVRKNFYFRIEDNEIPKRITFVQHPDPDQQRDRRSDLNTFRTLKNNLLSRIPIDDLKGNAIIDYKPDPNTSESYNQNVFDSRGQSAPATVIFLSDSDGKDANEVFDKVVEQFGETNNAPRIVVWYRSNDQLKHIDNTIKPAINNNASLSRKAINSRRP